MKAILNYFGPAGILVCPIPPLHPDPSRRLLFLQHLQTLFNKPTLISDDETISDVLHLVPTFKHLSISSLDSITISPTARASVFPDRCAKADDIVCLMLTSGSTGNSKAVALRHSNMLSAVRGKIQHHGSGPASRFLNWIAFDHVACVTEIHLHALAANASQYHVSPSAIIRNPRNLLEWCHRLRITYTFSPNFLLAQICREMASSHGSLDWDLSCIRTFVSGGEAVPVKTAIEFTNTLEKFGAPRSALSAGFGMTETCAGCIYSLTEIPREESALSVKYLSLGKPYDGANVRIIDTWTGAVCGPLESGQLQVKGTSMFQEYFDNPRATAESFSDGWFTTGDTAMVDDNGDLHLLGREKDCININGVKHPSVDLETYLEDLAINGIMKSFIFVSPLQLQDADTETYGVFYQHKIPIEHDLTQADIDTLLATNRAIKTRCTVFCSQAPHVILPLPRRSFFKTALGKISRSALAQAYLKGEHRELELLLSCTGPRTSRDTDEPISSVDHAVFTCVSRVFGVDVSSLSRASDMFDMGASSMHLIRLKQALQESLSTLSIPTIEMLTRPEIGDLSDYLTELQAQTSKNNGVIETKYNPIVCMNSTGTNPPLFLVHPGVGEVYIFINLARSFAGDRPVYALRARGFDNGQTPFVTLDDMVECYVQTIRDQYPSGPYYIGGYSFGGCVAFEIGKRLRSQGKDVAWVGIFNLPPRIKSRMNELVWSEVLLNLFMFLVLAPKSTLDSLRAEFLEAFPEMKDLDGPPDSPLESIKWVLDHSDQERVALLALSLEELKRWTDVAFQITCTGRSYDPSGTNPATLMTVFCAVPLPSMGTREEYKRDRLAKWEEFGDNRLELIDVDGEHYTMIAPQHVDSFAEKLKGALRRAEKPTVIPNDIFNGVQSAPIRAKQDFDEVPIIDFSLADTDPESYYKQLSFALEDVGFGVFVNVPGFEPEFQREVFDLAERLYSKPLEWKEALGTSNSYALRGYFRTDDIVGGHKCHAEAYRFGADMPTPKTEDGSEAPFWLRLHEGPNQWPSESDLPNFRSKMETLFERYRSLNLLLNSHICTLLSIPPPVLNDFFPTKTEFNSALWHYFPVTSELAKEARDGFVQGMHEHRDPSTFITCLIQSRAGLQVQNHQGKWIDIPMVEGGIVCNIGVQLMNLTGGRLVATLHRVNTLKIDVDRYTIPYVLTTKLEKPVLPLPQFDHPGQAKEHVAPNPIIQKMLSIEDPLKRSGFARLSLFPAATKKLYPREFEEGVRMGVL